MTGRDDSTVLSVIHPVCCGMDVHKEKIWACLLLDKEGSQEGVIQECETLTNRFFY